MNLTELVTSANARGHIGVRGVHETNGPVFYATNKAVSLELIRLISAWRSTEDDLPERWGGPVDRRVYGLTRKGWDVRINARDTLPSYQASLLAEALAAHYGELEEGPDLRYPEEAFNDWQNEKPSWYVGVDTASGPDMTAYGTCPAHQQVLPGGIVSALHPDPGHEVIITPYPGQELAVPDDYFIRNPGMEKLEWAVVCVVLTAATVIGWWLS